MLRIGKSTLHLPQHHFPHSVNRVAINHILYLVLLWLLVRVTKQHWFHRCFFFLPNRVSVHECSKTGVSVRDFNSTFYSWIYIFSDIFVDFWLIKLYGFQVYKFYNTSSVYCIVLTTLSLLELVSLWANHSLSTLPSPTKNGDLFLNYVLWIMLLQLSSFFPSLPFSTQCPLLPQAILPPLFTSMGHAYKFFRYSNSYTVVYFPMAVLYQPICTS